MEAGAGLGQPKAPPGSAQPHPGHTNSKDGNNSPGTTSTAQTGHRRGCKQGEGWETRLEGGRGSSSRAWAQLGARGVCTVGFGKGRYQTAKQQQWGWPGAAAGGQHGLLTSLRLRATPQKQNPGNTKEQLERFGPKHPLCSEQVPAEPCQPWALPSPPGAHSCQQEPPALWWHKEGTPARAAQPPRGLSPPALPLPALNSLAEPRAVLGAPGKHRTPPWWDPAGCSQGMSPCRKTPWGSSGHSQSSAQPLGALSCPWAGFPSLGCALKHPQLGAGGVSPCPQEHCRTRGDV